MTHQTHKLLLPRQSRQLKKSMADRPVLNRHGMGIGSRRAVAPISERVTRLRIFAAILGVSVALSQSVRAAPGPLIEIPVTDRAGQTIAMQTRLCRPQTGGAARLVVINHGSPPSAADRPGMRPSRCDRGVARWFLDRGYVVAFPLRRGYGATGGPFAETTGRCQQPDFVHSGIETARDINAAVDYLTSLPFVRHDGAVVVGVSAGGWGAIAYDSLPHPKVAAFVVMAGGRGGHEDSQPDENCRPDRLAEAAGQFGRTASTPMLWVYATNDTFFAPPIARALYQSFTKAGGQAEFDQPGPFGSDGHRLFFGAGGSAIWGPLVDHYLAEQHVTAQ